MNTRARLSASLGLAIAAVVLLGTHRAAAMDEPVETAEKPRPPAVHAEIDRQQFRNDIEAYARALTESLRSAVAAPPKPADSPPQDVELAAAQPHPRG